ncbi:MAG: lysostaphin resistance A-like protein [Haloarculaceae archaeon]
MQAPTQLGGMSDLSGLQTADWGTRARCIGMAILLSAAGYVGSNAVALVGVSFLSFLGVDLRANPALLFPVGTILQGLGFGLMVFGYVVYRSKWDLLRARLPSVSDLLWTAGGVVALVAALALISTVFSRLGVQVAQNQVETIGTEHPEMLLYMIPLAYLVIGPGEELLFRGAVQGVLRDAYAPAPAIFIASALFGVAHTLALSGEGKLAYVGAVVLLGAILGALYEVTDNLVVPSLVHGTYDALIFISIYARATGLA